MEVTIKCTLQYDGTAYRGFQRQPGQQPTIQGVLEEALASLTGQRTVVVAAGRTDSGVHAHGQVIHFRTRARIPIERWAAALNSRLPDDIVVIRAERASPDFHARFHAISKTYRYTIWNAPFPSPFLRRYAWWMRRPLDVAAMQEAAQLLQGRHDFSAFRAAGGSARTSTRTLSLLRVEVAEALPEGRLLHVWAQADGFLYHMVRNLVGTLVVVGVGDEEPGWAADVLASKDRNRAGPTAPAHGLTLWEVTYPPGS